MPSSLLLRFRPLIKVLLFAATVAVCILGYLFLLSVLRNQSFGGGLAAAFLAFACLLLNREFLRSTGGSLANIGLDAPRLRTRQFLAAFLAGTVLVCCWALVATGVTSAHWKVAGGLDRAALPGLLVFYVLNNAAEELAYRGYAFLVLEKAYGSLIAVTSTSMVFTLMHMQGGMPLPQAVAGTLTNALIFGVLFSRWKSFPVCLGFHLATNLVQDIVGLRQSALTLLTWSGLDVSGGRGRSVLVLVAGLNLAVVAFVSRRRNPGPATRVTTPVAETRRD